MILALRRPFTLLLPVSMLLAAAGGAEAGRTIPLPGPAGVARGHDRDPAAENRACEECHLEIAEEWRGSLHHASWDDPLFQTAYALEPQAFCRGCHVPEADPSRMAPEGARRLGVGCVTCHVQDGEIVSARARPASAAAHAVKGDARLAGPAACAGCHQFEFPRPQPAPMQGTIEEHRASPHASVPCQGCHMPRVADGRGGVRRRHDFRVLGDPALLRSAVAARAARSGERAITVTLSAAQVGHAVPTGDMFRRLEVRARLEGEPGAAATPVVLGRRFVLGGSAASAERIQVGDDRLPASGAPRTIELTFAERIDGRPVRWEVAHQRLDPGMAVAFGVDPQADETIVASGVLESGPAAR